MQNSIGWQADLNPRQQFAKRLGQFTSGAVRNMECLEGYNRMFSRPLLSRPDFQAGNPRISELDFKALLFYKKQLFS